MSRMPAGRWASLADFARQLVIQQRWMVLREAANLYRVTPETMQAWVRQGRFTAQRINGVLWIDRAELESGLRRPPRRTGARLE